MIPEAFWQAVAWLRRALGLDDDAFAAMVTRARERAWRVARVARLALFAGTYERLAPALGSGAPAAQARALVARGLQAAWGATSAGPGPRLELVVETNVQQAYQAARQKAASEPRVVKVRRFWLFSAVLDRRTSRICRALHGVKLPWDHPFWDRRHPPLHFHCRSLLAPVTEAFVEAAGGPTEVSKLPVAEALPGFGHKPPRPYQPKLAKVPPALRAAYERGKARPPPPPVRLREAS